MAQGLLGDNTCGRDEHVIAVVFVVCIFGTLVVTQDKLFSRFKTIQRIFFAYVFCQIVINHIYTNYGPTKIEPFSRNVVLTLLSFTFAIIVQTEKIRGYCDMLIGTVIFLYVYTPFPFGIAIPTAIISGMLFSNVLRHYPLIAANRDRSELITTCLIKAFPPVVTLFNISISPDRGQIQECYTNGGIIWNYPTNGLFVCDDRCKTAAQSIGWMNGTSGGYAVMMLVVIVVAAIMFIGSIKHNKRDNNNNNASSSSSSAARFTDLSMQSDVPTNSNAPPKQKARVTITNSNDDIELEVATPLPPPPPTASMTV